MENIRSFGSRIVSSAAFACLCLGASADSRSIMAVQIDLARQKETPSSVSNYMVRVELPDLGEYIRV